MQGEREYLRGRGIEKDFGSRRHDPFRFTPAVGSQLFVENSAQVGALPSGLRQQNMGPRQRRDTPLHGGNIAFLGFRPREADDRLHDRQRVPRAMVHLSHQQSLALLGALSVCNIDGHATETNDTTARIDAGRGSTDAPAQFSIRTMDPKLGLIGLPVLADARQRGLQPRPIVRMNQGANVVRRDREAARIDAENAILARIPGKVAAAYIPVPRPHLPRCQRQAAELLALQQARRR